MSDRYPNRQAVANKIEWEGGLIDALSYGIRAGQMPEGDEALTAAWAELDAAWTALQPLAEAVEALLPDPGPEADGE